jgi:hypothetical protein
VVLSWAAFTTTFVGLRALTHWIRAGHGPSGGGMSVGGRHFHHYNIGIALLAVVGAVALRGAEKHRRHPVTAVAYGSATALIVDELALLLDLKDVYWANQRWPQERRCGGDHYRRGWRDRHGSAVMATRPSGADIPLRHDLQTRALSRLYEKQG